MVLRLPQRLLKKITKSPLLEFEATLFKKIKVIEDLSLVRKKTILYWFQKGHQNNGKNGKIVFIILKFLLCLIIFLSLQRIWHSFKFVSNLVLDCVFYDNFRNGDSIGQHLLSILQYYAHMHH